MEYTESVMAQKRTYQYLPVRINLVTIRRASIKSITPRASGMGIAVLIIWEGASARKNAEARDTFLSLKTSIAI